PEAFGLPSSAPARLCRSGTIRDGRRRSLTVAVLGNAGSLPPAVGRRCGVVHALDEHTAHSEGRPILPGGCPRDAGGVDSAVHGVEGGEPSGLRRSTRSRPWAPPPRAGSAGSAGRPPADRRSWSRTG